MLIQRYPRAKFIVMDDVDKSADRNNDAILTRWKGPMFSVCIVSAQVLGVHFVST